MTYHIPVMLDEVLRELKIQKSGIYVDGTFGGGGHSSAILEQLGPDGRVIGCDADRVAIGRGEEIRTKDPRLELRQGYFGDLSEEMLEEGMQVDGVLLDLGVSSRQLDSDQIGLSYRNDMALDMRFDPEERDVSAADIVNEESAGEIATLLRRYGEEPAAWKIAQAIETERRRRAIRTTMDLRHVIEGVIPERFIIKTLTRVFQALRIAVNDELGQLERGLPSFVGLLKPGGRIAVLTYHSLEDRIVKQAFREEEKECICPPEYVECRCEKVRRVRVITRKPLTPTPDEIEANPRSRSAKLRVAERI